MLIGEAPGEDEIKAGLPFVGVSGRELTSMLSEAGINRHECSLTNVFDLRPPNNDLNQWKLSKKEALQNVDPSLPFTIIPLQSGVISPSYTQPALQRLFIEIETANPRVIVCLGNTALTALTAVSGITKRRGMLHFFRGRKVIPTFHPAAVLRTYEWRVEVVSDLIKAKKESASIEANFLERTLYIKPTIEDLREWEENLRSASRIAIDIETKRRQITMIGFAPSPTEVYVIPFWTPSGSYWPSKEEEIVAYKTVKSICGNSSEKIFHNGMYDISYLHSYGIPVANFLHDTMLLHHSLYPHLPKSLGYLGSLHCNERAWKAWRRRGSDTHELKRDE